MIRTAPLAAALLLASCGPTPPTPEEAQQAESEALILAAMSGIKEGARDPSSVKFGRVIVVRRTGKPIVCGYYNAKNGFGGYTGDTAFMAEDGTIYMPGYGLTKADFRRKWNATCSDETPAA